MADFKQLIKAIQEAVEDFAKQMPKIQQRLADTIRVSLSELDIKGGTVKISAANLKAVAKIKSHLQEAILDDGYKKEVAKFVAAFDTITDLQHAYFRAVDEKFTPPKLSKQLQKQAIDAVVSSLSESGLDANVISGVDDILRTNVTTGGSINDLQKQLDNFVLDNDAGEGILTKYTKQITADSLNQYSAQYTQIISNDLGLEWFYYAGSNIETSRPWCLACSKKKYIHISEFPALLKGDFPEFREFDGKMYRGLPAGMYPDTTVANLQIKRGGYFCGHQLRPVSEFSVPPDYKARIAGFNLD